MLDYSLIEMIDANLEDLPRIVEIYNSTIPGRMVTADTESVSVKSKEKWFFEHSKSSRPLWIVKYAGEICGWLSFQSFYGRPAYKATIEVSIYIDIKFINNGLGRFLLQKALEKGADLGIKTILGFIFGHNVPSLNLFYSLGFNNWGSLPGIAELDGIERDLIIVGKRINR